MEDDGALPGPEGRLDRLRDARTQGLTHVVLGLVGVGVAVWIWESLFRFLGGLGFFRGPFTFLAAAAALYELAVGVQFFREAGALEELAETASGTPTDLDGPTTPK
jgi:hypothetical protein